MPKPKPESRKPGRPKLSEADAKGRIVPVRFKAEDLEKIARAAQAKNQTLSQWIRSTLSEAIQ
jgi:predicted HicB family RNase H-like nuclease